MLLRSWVRLRRTNHDARSYLDKPEGDASLRMDKRLAYELMGAESVSWCALASRAPSMASADLLEENDALFEETCRGRGVLQGLRRIVRATA